MHMQNQSSSQEAFLQAEGGLNTNAKKVIHTNTKQHHVIKINLTI